MAKEDILNITDLDGFDREFIDVPLDFKINDFRDIGSRQGSHSKTIKVPGTKKNDSIFSWRFQLDTEGLYDDNKLTPVVIERDNLRILQGNLQLYNVITNDGKIVEYECAIYSNNAEWFTSIGDGSIRDLDLGKHVWDEQTIIDSWTNQGDGTEGYVYGLVDYSFFTSATAITDIIVERMRPATFILPIFKKILNNAGFTLSSEFFKKQEFRDLCILFTQEFIEIDLLGTILVDRASDFTIEQTPTTKVILWDDEVTGLNKDNDDAYDPLTGEWVCPQDGSYRIAMGVGLRSTTASSGTASMRILKNGTPIKTETYSIFENNNPNLIIREVGITPGRNAAALVAGDVIKVDGTIVSGAPAFASVVKDSYFQIDALPDAMVGHTIQLRKQLPDIKQKDLVKWLFTTFNLVSTTDNRTGVVTVEPRDQFYKDIDDAEDWTELVDYSKPIEFTKITEGLSKTLNFFYKEDDLDDNLSEFVDRNKQGLGDGKEGLLNEYLKGSQDVIPDIFAATFMDESFDGTLFMPSLINNELASDAETATGIKEYSKFEPRVCYYNGLADGDWTFETNAQTQFPQLLFYKRGATFRDISLAYGNLRDVDSSINARDTGLKDRFYRNQFNNFNFGRLVTAHLKLDATDILTLDFQKLKFININGERKYFILNKIENYRAGSPETTLCEFLEWKPSQSVKQAIDEPVQPNFGF